MRRLALAVALLAVLPAGAQAIVGGKPAADGQYPFAARVGSFCTGTLVAPTWVLTAEDCAAASTVTLGTVRTDGSGGELHSVASAQAESGVALLELSEPASQTPVQIVAPGDGTLWRDGALMAIAGFGAVAVDGTPPDVLQQAGVPRVANGACSAPDTKTQLCAGSAQGAVATCEGDAGGPLLAFVPGGFRLVGISAARTGCAREGLYARLASGPVKTFVFGVVPSAYAAEPATCSGVAGLRLKVSQRRRVSLYVDGRRRMRVRGPVTLHFASLLPREGSAKVRIVIGGLRTIRRTYTNCR